MLATEAERDAFGPLDAAWVVKRGPDGVNVAGVDHPALPTEIVDPTGAGDAFAAGFLVGGVRARPRSGGPLLRQARRDAVIRLSEEVRDGARGRRRGSSRSRRRSSRTVSRRARASRSGSPRRAPSGPAARCRPRSASSTARSSIGLTPGGAGALRRVGPQGRPARPRRRGRAGRGGRDDGRRHARRVPRRRHPLHGDRRARRRSPRLARSTRCLGRPRRARAHSGARRSRRASSRSSTFRQPPSCSRRSASRCSAGRPTSCRSSTPPTAARPVSARVEAASEAARIARAHWQLGGGGLLLGRPPDESLDDVEPLIEEALAEAAAAGVRGGAVTPFVLARLHSESGGRTLKANRDLIEGNALLAGQIAAA